MLARLVCVCLMLPAVTATAQHKLGLAVKAGPNFANMRVKEKSTGRVLDTRMQIEPSATLEMEIVISKHFSYILGLQLLAHSYSAHSADSVSTFEYLRRATYLGVPNKIRVFFNYRRIQSFLSFGINAESLLSGRLKKNYHDPAITDYERDIKVQYNPVIFTPELDIGLRYALAKFYLTLEGTHAHSLESVNNTQTEAGATHSRRIRDFRLMIGISHYLY
ncbi:MAG: hypothetical protein ONB44_21735 [candidate division KSB1 bacterium]|nr:hypothetical protein [candidate division KSB1 bacterium]MDZ7304759.1 hypothetical protein [candidate division KSB1 bacterium]MDZ7314207.1 hypothetical protein [candidate division KSB1 bacterium]